MRTLLAVGLIVVCAACGDDDAASTPARDAGESRDGGREGRDAAAPPDAGSLAADGGERDARVVELDTGAPIDDGPGQTITIRFQPQVRDEPLDCNRVYVIPGLGRVEPREFKFYVQDLALIDRSGREVPVRMLQRLPHQIPAVALLDFEDGTGSCRSNASLNSEIVGKVPEGDYRGIVFTNGVPAEYNHDDPTTFPPPLQDFSMYWDWFQGFKFLVADLGAASAAPGGGEDDAGIAPAQSVLHVGSAACGVGAGMEIDCALPNRNRIRLPEFEPNKHVIVADLAAVFAGVPADQTFCHGGRSTCAPVYRNVGLELATGKATEGQKVFRVEASP